MLIARVLVLTFICTASFSTGTVVKCVAECQQSVFKGNVNHCLFNFNKSMESSGYQDYCPWPTVKGIYNDLKCCVDKLAKKSCCTGRGFLVEEVFLEIHQMYFFHCGKVNLNDPSLFTLIMLIAPVVVVTFIMPLLCVHLTTW